MPRERLELGSGGRERSFLLTSRVGLPLLTCEINEIIDVQTLGKATNSSLHSPLLLLQLLLPPTPFFSPHSCTEAELQVELISESSCIQLTWMSALAVSALVQELDFLFILVE